MLKRSVASWHYLASLACAVSGAQWVRDSSPSHSFEARLKVWFLCSTSEILVTDVEFFISLFPSTFTARNWLNTHSHCTLIFTLTFTFKFTFKLNIHIHIHIADWHNTIQLWAFVQPQFPILKFHALSSVRRTFQPISYRPFFASTTVQGSLLRT